MIKRTVQAVGGFVALTLVRVLLLGLVGVMGFLGVLICAPFPSFWRSALQDDDRCQK